jgi:hypothetical protein
MGAAKSLARLGRKQATATEVLVFIYPIYNLNWRNINTIYIYNKTSIKKIFSPSNKIHREVGRAKDLPAPRYNDLLQFHTETTRSFYENNLHR